MIKIELVPGLTSLYEKCNDGIEYYGSNCYLKYHIALHDNRKESDHFFKSMDLTTDEFESLFKKGFCYVRFPFEDNFYKLTNYDDYVNLIVENPNEDFAIIAKEISLSSITELFRLNVYLQIGGLLFDHYENPPRRLSYKYHDCFYLDPDDLSKDQIQRLKQKKIPIANDTRDVQERRGNPDIFIPTYSDIEGYYIEKIYYPLSFLGRDPRKIKSYMRKETFFLDAQNPDQEIVKRLESLPQPSIYHTFEEKLKIIERNNYICN